MDSITVLLYQGVINCGICFSQLYHRIDILLVIFLMKVTMRTLCLLNKVFGANVECR